MKAVTDSGKYFSNPLQGSGLQVAAKKLFWKPPVIMKIVPKAVYDMLLEKIDQWEGRKAASAILFALSKQSLN